MNEKHTGSTLESLFEETGETAELEALTREKLRQEGYDTLVVIGLGAEACETFCPSCGQLRLYCKEEPATACGGCGSADIEVGPVGSAELAEKRRAWRMDRRQRYPCLSPGCSEPAAYFARGNSARLGHICGDCWRELPAAERELYAIPEGER